MIISKKVICILLTLVFISFANSFCSLRTDSTAADLKKIDNFISNVRNKLQLKSGLGISIVKGDKVIFSRAYGYSKIDKKIPAKTITPFYIASSTKSFTAELAKNLSDEGILSLDEPISKYLPDLKLPPPLTTKLITIRDLLTHRSGLENIPVILRTAYTGQYTEKKLLQLFAHSKFVGKKFRYSNIGYVLTGLIIQKVTGKSWKDLLKEKFFDPLGMKNTSAYVSYFNAG